MSKSTAVKPLSIMEQIQRGANPVTQKAVDELSKKKSTYFSKEAIMRSSYEARVQRTKQGVI